MTLAQLLLPNLNRFRLDTVAKAIGVHLGNHHRAVDDAACTADIFLKFIEMLKERGIHTLDEVNAECAQDEIFPCDHAGDQRYRTREPL